MAQELMSGKRFKSSNGVEIFYDEMFYANPFRYGSEALDGLWGCYNNDFWTEVPRHVHQGLKDNYQKGQAWQYKPHPDKPWADCKDNLDQWIEPAWAPQYNYRIKPSTKLVYELMGKGSYSGNWATLRYLYTEEEISKLPSDLFRKTGRSWEVEE
jgi:hypothetical protein